MEKPSLDNAAAKAATPVPCPRCQSSNTKFCYYNNHNLNQPRHFCRDCQRYWTAGGSLRNVPVGAGKRKHKGPHTIPTKPENLPGIFAFHPDQGVYPSLDPPNVLSFKQHVSQGYGDSRLGESPTAVSQPAPVQEIESKPQIIGPPVSRPHIDVSYDAENVPQARAYVCSPGAENLGFTEIRKQQPSLSLGLNLSKEADAKESDGRLASPLNISCNPPLSQNAGKQQDSRPLQYNTERDESTGCSSVTANLGCSAPEAAAESNNPSAKAPPTSSAEQASGVMNPMAALGASMCPPWLWPFMMNGRNIAPPPGLPQVDPTFAAAAMHAMATMSPMAGMPPIHPAFAAAMGAMASGGSRLPQIDPNFMAAVTASFMQFPQLWNPYAWGLPWNAAWNVTNAVVNVPTNVVLNAPNGVNKRPASPSQEQGGTPRPFKRENVQEAPHTTGFYNVDAANVPNFPCPAGYFDAFRPKVDVSQLKPTSMQQSDEQSDAHQRQPSPHSNPAAQARSVAFQEGSN